MTHFVTSAIHEPRGTINDDDDELGFDVERQVRGEYQGCYQNTSPTARGRVQMFICFIMPMLGVNLTVTVGPFCCLPFAVSTDLRFSTGLVKVQQLKAQPLDTTPGSLSFASDRWAALPCAPSGSNPGNSPYPRGHRTPAPRHL